MSTPSRLMGEDRKAQPEGMPTTAQRIIWPVVLLVLGVALGWGVATWRGAAPPTEAAGAAATSAAGAASAPGARRVLYWYDPMVPTQKFSQPGKSPFMDMQLVPRYAEDGEAEGAGASTLSVSTRAQQALGLRLATVEKRRIGAALEAVGSVQLNERDVSIVQARTAGFVERVYARAPGDVVAAGAPLADVLNPEWLGAQQEYLAVKATGEAALAQAARQRLAWLGMPAGLIERMEQSGQPVGIIVSFKPNTPVYKTA